MSKIDYIKEPEKPTAAPLWLDIDEDVCEEESQWEGMVTIHALFNQLKMETSDFIDLIRQYRYVCTMRFMHGEF